MGIDDSEIGLDWDAILTLSCNWGWSDTAHSWTRQREDYMLCKAAIWEGNRAWVLLLYPDVCLFVWDKTLASSYEKGVKFVSGKHLEMKAVSTSSDEGKSKGRILQTWLGFAVFSLLHFIDDSWSLKSIKLCHMSEPRTKEKKTYKIYRSYFQKGTTFWSSKMHYKIEHYRILRMERY